jgi:hypothetical protein
MELKTFKVDLSVTLVGFCDAKTEQISGGLLEHLLAAIDDYATKRRLSYDECRVTAADGRGNISTSHAVSASQPTNVTNHE